MSKFTKVDKIEQIIKKVDEFEDVDFFKNILEIGYERKWDIHTIAKCIDKAYDKRMAQVPIGYMDFDFERTSYLSKIEITFIEYYREQASQGNLFVIHKGTNPKFIKKLIDGEEPENIQENILL